MCAKKHKENDRRSGRIYIPYEKVDEGSSWIWIVIMLWVFWPVGGIMLFKKLRGKWRKKKLADFRNYAAVISNRNHIDIKELSSKLGKTPSLVMSDLQMMIDKGYLGANAYIDRSQGILVMDALETEFVEFEEESVQEEPQPVSKTEPKPESKPEPNPAPPPEPAMQREDDFEEKLRQIRRLNDEIDDEAVSNRIDRIGELTASIFAVVRQKPERADEVRKFMNYYLPTTFKLLKSYALMEKQSYQGENITASRQKIESILDSLITAFEQQQDRLFKTEALDVDADIQVLETMMAKDGLVTPKELDLRAVMRK